jgi:hypothetical protein
MRNSNRNIALWAEAGRRHGALGLLNTDWGDSGHYNLQGNSWFAYAMGAQQSWAGECPDSDFDRAFSRLVFGDRTGEVARLYRALGDIHDTGFVTFNGSPIQFLFFDDIDDATFVAASKRGTLAKSERRLLRVREKLDRAKAKFGSRTLTWRELVYAADASLFALRKARAGLDYLDWRRRPEAWKAAERRRLAKTLARLADEQVALGRTLRKLWLARSFESNLSQNERRLRKSIKSLRAGARALERNRPRQAPEARELSGRVVLESLRSSYEEP